MCRQPNNQRDGRAGRDRHLHVDHDHETGKIRGLLCHACNIVLGLVKDDPDRLRLLANYLEVSNGCVSEA